MRQLLEHRVANRLQIVNNQTSQNHHSFKATINRKFASFLFISLSCLWLKSTCQHTQCSQQMDFAQMVVRTRRPWKNCLTSSKPMTLMHPWRSNQQVRARLTQSLIWYSFNQYFCKVTEKKCLTCGLYVRVRSARWTSRVTQTVVVITSRKRCIQKRVRATFPKTCVS